MWHLWRVIVLYHVLKYEYFLEWFLVFQYSVFWGKKRSSSCTLGGNSFVLGRFRYTQVTECGKRVVLVLVDNRSPAESWCVRCCWKYACYFTEFSSGDFNKGTFFCTTRVVCCEWCNKGYKKIEFLTFAISKLILKFYFDLDQNTKQSKSLGCNAF